MTLDSSTPSSVHSVLSNNTNGDERIVLIVEDDPVFSHLLAAQFRLEGYRPVQQYRGQNACAVAAIVRPKVITLDIILQDLNGWDVLSELKRLPFMHSVPVLIISILDETELKGTLGPTEFLHKPSRRADLTNAIMQLAPTADAPLRILVIDDEPLVGELSKSFLTMPQFEVQVARSARAAAKWLESSLPDLVLLDLVMPQVTGFELLATLRSDPRTRHLPVLVWTAKHLNSQEQHDLSQAAQVVLPKKQFSSTRLSETLRYLERIHAFSSPEKPLTHTGDYVDMSEFRDDFLREARDHLAHINGWLNNRDPGKDGDTLEPIVRAAHTLKSGAAIMEMSDLSHVAFETETILNCIAKQEAQLDLYTLDTLRLLSDEMQQLLAVA